MQPDVTRRCELQGHFAKRSAIAAGGLASQSCVAGQTKCYSPPLSPRVSASDAGGLRRWRRVGFRGFVSAGGAFGGRDVRRREFISMMVLLGSVMSTAG